MRDTAVRIAVLVHQPILMTLDTILYFGCRSAHKDQHYRSEWEAYVREQKLRYRVACSRDGLEGSKRTYVQDLMRNDAQGISGKCWGSNEASLSSLGGFRPYVARDEI